jgi:hypothetical protein
MNFDPTPSLSYNDFDLKIFYIDDLYINGVRLKESLWH